MSNSCGGTCTGGDCTGGTVVGISPKMFLNGGILSLLPPGIVTPPIPVPKKLGSSGSLYTGGGGVIPAAIFRSACV